MRAARVSGLREVRDFGIERTKAGVGPVVLGVPLKAPIEFRPQLLDRFFALGDLPLGPVDVARERLDLFE